MDKPYKTTRDEEGQDKATKPLTAAGHGDDGVLQPVEHLKSYAHLDCICEAPYNATMRAYAKETTRLFCDMSAWRAPG